MKKEIGLVLSGGGTKGIAEAGALKFLEKKIFFQKSLQERVLVQLLADCILLENLLMRF